MDDESDLFEFFLSQEPLDFKSKFDIMVPFVKPPALFRRTQPKKEKK